MKVQGVCKDCGNGTLNNELNPAFGEDYNEEGYVLYCLVCRSTHLDLLVEGEGDTEEEAQ